MNRLVYFIFLGCLCLVIAGTGCSGMVGLSGQVTYSDTGEPLEAGTVAFVSDRHQAMGTIGQDGRYVVGSLREADGLPPGRYRVFITDAIIVTNSEELEQAAELAAEQGTGGTAGGRAISIMPMIEHLIDPKFTSPDTSDLVVEVGTSRRNTFDIQVDRASPARQR